MIHLITLTLVAASSAGPVFLEPESEAPFEEFFEVDGRVLTLSGADVRKVWGDIAYAIGHYIEDNAILSSSDEESRLEACIEHEGYKAISLHGTYSKVPAYGIRWSWKRSLKQVDYDGPHRRDFVRAFDEAFLKEQKLHLIAQPGGTLMVIHEGEIIGKWTDRDLVRAVWEISLGEDSEVYERTNLVQREHLLPDRIATD